MSDYLPNFVVWPVRQYPKMEEASGAAANAELNLINVFLCIIKIEWFLPINPTPEIIGAGCTSTRQSFPLATEYVFAKSP